jgi:tight adherence protein B
MVRAGRRRRRRARNVIRPALAAALVATAVVLLAVAMEGERRRRFLERVAPPDDDVSAGASSRGIPRRVVSAVCGIVGAWIGAFVAGPVGGVALGFGAFIAPIAVERRQRARRDRALEEQLLGAVIAIAAALRSGRSLVQALGVAAEEADEPLGAVLTGAAHDAALGVPIDEVLDGLAEAIRGSNVRLLTGVLKLHRRTGGALAAALDDVARTLAARRDGAREIRSLTAQARLSAAILGLLPLGFFLFLSVVARRDVQSAYETTGGSSAIGVGLALQGAAFVWIRRLLRVEDAA